MGRKFMSREKPPIPIRALIIGEAKIGKTTLAATFPDPYGIFMGLEGGQNALYGKDVDGYICDDWDEVVAKIREFTNYVKSKKNGYRTFIFDGLSFSGLMLEDYLKKRNFKDPRQMWGVFAAEMQAMIRELHTTPCHIVYTGHTQIRENDGGQVVDAGLLFPGKFGKLLPAAVDGIVYMERGLGRDQNKKVVRTVRSHLQRYQVWPAGFRMPGLPPFIENMTFQKLTACFAAAGVTIADYDERDDGSVDGVTDPVESIDDVVESKDKKPETDSAASGSGNGNGGVASSTVSTGE